MAAISRLIAGAIALVLLAVAGLAYAEQCTQHRLRVSVGGGACATMTIDGGWVAGASRTSEVDNAMASALRAAVNGATLALAPGYESNYTECYLTATGTTYSNTVIRSHARPKTGAVLSSTHSFSYQSRQGNYCMPETCPEFQEPDEETLACTCAHIENAGMFMVDGDGIYGCRSGCKMLLTAGWYDSQANVTWGMWTQTGFGSCTVGTPNVLSGSDPKVEAAKRCDPGQCPGTVNGQSVCVPCDKAKQQQTSSSESTTETTAPGASSPTSSSSESRTESSRTECANGSCTTTRTTTTIGADGEKQETESMSTEPQSDYCTKNPKAPVCKGLDSSWGGSCGSFSCDGDAVQCAQARAGWELACAMKVDEANPAVLAGQAAMNGELRPAGHPGAEGAGTEVHLPDQIDTTPLFGAQGCIADKTVVVMGKSITLPLSTICPYLEMMGAVWVAACYLIAAFTVFRR